MSFELLSEPIRKYIRDKRWEELRPIQNAAISRILTTDNNYILASRTASGKTEAAFLPILSKANFNETGVQVLYISPLIALINDQFHRVEELCKYLEVTVTKWHGEANKSLKERLLANPQGIVLITPESLEAMFVNKPFNVKHLFSRLKFVVIDEIHSFIGTDRGTHLKSILSRLQDVNQSKFNIIGLSATIGDYDEAKKFTGNEDETKILLDRTAKEINAKFRYFKSETEELPLELLKDLYLETKDNKALIFPNSRGRVEEVAVKLKKISDRVNGHSNYFSHHSSVHKEVREYVEFFAKNNRRENFAISCTSTLELGIDIGTVEEVVQIDATNSVASLIQRVGRSGRQDGKRSNLFLYATDQWNLLQSLACWELYKEGFIEPPQIVEKPYDILLHQALSITKGTSGIRLKDLIVQLKNNFAFRQIEFSEIEEIINHLIKIDFLEKLQNELIIGIEGEKIVNSRDFYGMFSTETNLKVINAGNTVGEIPFSPQLKEDENIFLAARIWKITNIDLKSNKIEVISAKDGKKPKFSGGGTIVHSKIREKMLEILFSQKIFDVLDEKSSDEIEKLRKEFSIFAIQDIQIERPLLINENKVKLFTFTGTKINRTLGFLLKSVEIKHRFDENSSSFEIELSPNDFLNQWELYTNPMQSNDKNIGNLIEMSSTILTFSKWGLNLPIGYKIELMKQKYFSLSETKEALRKYKIIQNK
jgi:ATP-dependent helicase Lhr and Lhr-like helicase